MAVAYLSRPLPPLPAWQTPQMHHYQFLHEINNGRWSLKFWKDILGGREFVWRAQDFFSGQSDHGHLKSKILLGPGSKLEVPG